MVRAGHWLSAALIRRRAGVGRPRRAAVPTPGRPRRWRRWPKVVLAAQLAAAAVLLCRGLGWLQPAELAAYDRLVAAWAGQDRSGRILVVPVTEEDIGRYGWPLRDADLAALLGRLTSWGARAIGVDIYRDRPLPPGEQALAGLLQQYPEILWVYKLPDEGGGRVPPPLILAGNPRAVLADVVTDPGGVVRRGLLAATDARTGRSIRTLGTALAEQYTAQALQPSGDDVALGGGRVALVTGSFGPYAQVDAAGYQTLLDFLGGRDRFRRLSLGSLMQGDAAAPLVRGRAVLIGTEAPSVNDSLATPFSTGLDGGKPLAGVMLHAHLADQLIRAASGEAAGRTAPSRAADAAAVWACSTAAGAIVLALPSAGAAFAAVLAGGTGVIAWATYAAFGMGLILPGVPSALAWAAAAAGGVWMLHGIGIRDRLRLRRSFEHYLDPRIIEDMLAAETLPSFGGERREVTVMFTDIAGFTTLAETLPAEEVAALLRDYFDGVCAAILACGGLLSVFHGDGLQVLFGAPRQQGDHADCAVDAALRIDSFACRFSAEQRKRGLGFGLTRVGVHTGAALVGNVGTRARLNYGAVGDMVNTASRVEGLNKLVGTRVAVSGETAVRCTRHRFRPVGEFVLLGRRDALPVFTPLVPAEVAHTRHVLGYEAAYAALRAGRPEAGAMFLALGPDDPCAAFHRARLEAGEAGVRIVMKDK
jgi:adenylate cyclase